jgi:pimeloyl-ACP methyl ester carboxylesterase
MSDLSELPSTEDPRLARLLAVCSQPTESHTVDVDGCAVAYLSWNAGELHKPALLFVHGFVAHARWWSFVAPHFTEQFRVYAMDLSGMGDSGRRERYGIAHWRDEIAAVARAVGGEGACSLVGHSFGAARCFEACAVYPDLFERFVAVDTYLHFADAPPRPKSFTAARPVRRFPDQESAIERFRLIPPQWSAPWMLEHIVRHSLRPTPEGWCWKFDETNLRSTDDEEDSVAMLRGMKVPVYLVHGQHSPIATRERMARLAGLMPSCPPPIEIPQGYHHLMLDQPFALISALRAIFSCTRR